MGWWTLVQDWKGNKWSDGVLFRTSWGSSETLGILGKKVNKCKLVKDASDFQT